MNIQKVENACAAYWAKTESPTVTGGLVMIRAMYGAPAVPYAKYYMAWHLEGTEAGEDSVEDCYVDVSELERQFPAYTDRSNKE